MFLEKDYFFVLFVDTNFPTKIKHKTIQTSFKFLFLFLMLHTIVIMRYLSEN